MGATNTSHYTNLDNKLAAFCKALAHPARLTILKHVAKMGSCICNDIVDELPLAQPTISQHLRELKSLGLIKGSVEGASICYCIDKEVWDEYQMLFNELFSDLKPAGNCC